MKARTIRISLALLVVLAISVTVASAEKPRRVYLRGSVIAVLRVPVRGMSITTRYNMVKECIRPALIDKAATSKSARVEVATKTEVKYFGSYKFEIRKGDNLLMVGKHIIHIITPEDAAAGQTTMAKQAKFLLANFKKKFDLSKITRGPERRSR